MQWNASPVPMTTATFASGPREYLVAHRTPTVSFARAATLASMPCRVKTYLEILLDSLAEQESDPPYILLFSVGHYPTS